MFITTNMQMDGIFLYKDSPISLNRKKLKFEELLIYCERSIKI